MNSTWNDFWSKVLGQSAEQKVKNGATKGGELPLPFDFFVYERMMITKFKVFWWLNRDKREVTFGSFFKWTTRSKEIRGAAWFTYQNRLFYLCRLSLVVNGLVASCGKAAFWPSGRKSHKSEILACCGICQARFGTMKPCIQNGEYKKIKRGDFRYKLDQRWSGVGRSCFFWLKQVSGYQILTVGSL